MDVAVGNGGGKNPPGVAPGADIIFVEAALGDFKLGQSFGNSRHLVDAVKYIFDKASELKRPAVVNISLSFDAGPHDGSTPVEEAFDCMLETPGRAIVLAAGNSCRSMKHLRRRIYPGQPRTLRWVIPESDTSTNKLEIWYGGAHALEVRLRSPRENVMGPFALGTTFTIRRKSDEGQEVVAGHVFHRFKDSGNQDNHVVLMFGRPMEPGTWKVELSASGSSTHMPFDVDAWIERDDGSPSTLPDEQPSDSLCTLGTLACGLSTIAVSAYNTFEPHRIMESSGAGPTRDGKLKPEVSAPGLELKVAEALTDSVDRTGGGTSISAPHVAGLVALLMQAADDLLPIEQTRDLVLNFARHNPPPEDNAWEPRYGAGRINAASSVAATPEFETPLVAVVEHFEHVAAEIISVSAGNAELPPGLPAGAVTAVSVSVKTTSTVVAVIHDAPSAPAALTGGDVASNGAAGGESAPAPPVTEGH